jgi:hypothetical protein
LFDNGATNAFCRVLSCLLSDLKQRGVIEVSRHSITSLDGFVLEAIGEDPKHC